MWTRITHLHISTDDGQTWTRIPYEKGTEETLPDCEVIAHSDPCPYVVAAMNAYAYN